MCDDYVGSGAGSGRGEAPADGRTRLGCPECAARGDLDAFVDLYDDTIDDVHQLALLLRRGDARAAAAVVRRTYAEVWRTASSFRAADGRPHTWVLGVAQTVGRVPARPGPRPHGDRAA